MRVKKKTITTTEVNSGKFIARIFLMDVDSTITDHTRKKILSHS